MNTAIKCSCRTVIVYDTNTEELQCPKCQRRYYRQPPPMIGDDGCEAEIHPYLCQNVTSEPWTDRWAVEIIEAIDQSIQNHNEQYRMFGAEKQEPPPTVAFVGVDTTLVDWPKDFKKEHSINISELVDEQA